jgi:predicted negative regulator of RcsB-dependent stress response
MTRKWSDVVARRRLTRKEIKQPDQFVSSTAQIADWVAAHLRHVLYAGLGVLVIIGLAIGWSAWQRHRQQKAEALLYGVVKLLNASENASDGQVAEKPDVERAMQQLHMITRDYRGTRASALAYWYLGHLYFERGAYTEALASYEQTRRLLVHDNQRLIPALITLNIGYAQEASGNCDEAIVSFDQVLQSSAEWLRGETFLGMGRCYESTDAAEKAMTLYDRALSDAAVSGASRQQIEERQARLQAVHNVASESPQEKPETATPQQQ